MRKTRIGESFYLIDIDMNHDMVKINDVIKILDAVRDEIIATGSYKNSDLAIIDRIRRSICKLEIRKRLTVINGGKE